MSDFCPNVLKSNVQRAFVMIEDTAGVLVKPAATGFILPAGRGVISQSPSYTDSPELSSSLDVVSQSRDAMPPGEWSLPMAIRMSESGGNIQLQGDALFHALTGKKVQDSTINTYSLDVCRPTVSVWIQNDEVVQFMSGCVVEEMTWSVERSGIATVAFSGRGRRAGVVGVGELAAVPTGTSVKLENGQAKAFSVGGYVRNKSKNETTEYQITGISTETDTLTLDAAPSGWVAGEVIAPWLPSATVIGKEVENNSAAFFVDGQEGRIRPTTFTASMPTQFIEEVGDVYPGESADNRRAVSIDFSVYFRKADAVRFGQALEGSTHAIKMNVMRDYNLFFEVNMPKVRLSYPTVGEDGAVLTLDSTGTALGENGEDSFDITVYRHME